MHWISWNTAAYDWTFKNKLLLKYKQLTRLKHFSSRLKNYFCVLKELVRFTPCCLQEVSFQFNQGLCQSTQSLSLQRLKLLYKENTSPSKLYNPAYKAQVNHILDYNGIMSTNWTKTKYQNTINLCKQERYGLSSKCIDNHNANIFIAYPVSSNEIEHILNTELQHVVIQACFPVGKWSTFIHILWKSLLISTTVHNTGIKQDLFLLS